MSSRTYRVILISVLSTILLGCNKPHNSAPPIRPEYIEQNVTLSEWQIFILALIEVESENNPKAIGNKNGGGILQITPIFIKEANRIQSKDTFQLEDRFDIQKSLEIFYAVNKCHNKDCSIDKAIKLHNPNAPASYRIKIKNKMQEISKREDIRHCLLILKN